MACPEASEFEVDAAIQRKCRTPLRQERLLRLEWSTKGNEGKLGK